MNLVKLKLVWLVLFIVETASAQNTVYYESTTGLIHLDSYLQMATIEIRSNAGRFLGERSEFPHFDGLFDAYEPARVFKLDPDSFGAIHSFARLPSGLSFHDLEADLVIDGSALGAGVVFFDLFASQPCTVCLNFDSPITDDVTIIGGASTGIQATGGHPFGNLQLTDDTSQQAGAIILPREISPANHRVIIAASTDSESSSHRIDNLGLNPGSGESMTDSADFHLTADVQIPRGSTKPGNGFSINVVQPHDPILTNAENGVLAGFASSSDGQPNRLEEGATTGLAIGFDEASNGDEDVVGISLRVDNQVVTQFPLEKINGDIGDPTSLQTGWLDWAPLSLTVSDAKPNDYYGSHVTIDWKEHTVFDGPVAIVGDSNLDKHFDSSDLVHVFTAGHFETGVGATWESGDWNLDGVFDSSDLVTAFSADTFSNTAVQVPETIASHTVLSVLFLSIVCRARRSRRTAAILPSEKTRLELT